MKIGAVDYTRPMIKEKAKERKIEVEIWSLD